jgi:Bax protein
MHRNICFLHPEKKYQKLFLFLFIFAGTTFSLSAQNNGYIRVVPKEIHSVKDIVPVKGPVVTPYVYTNTISLSNLPVQQKKQKFFDMLLPSVLVAKANMDITRNKLQILALKRNLTPADTNFLMPLMKKYHTSDIKVLIQRMQTLPVCIILAQAAIESGWGSSRFFLEGNNIFGMWSFNASDNRMAASSHRNGTKIYLQKFNNIEEAIDAYFQMLNTRRIFAPFRVARQKTGNPLVLIDSLKMYSERGSSYISDLGSIIRANHLEKYDTYKINPVYIMQ